MLEGHETTGTLLLVKCCVQVGGEIELLKCMAFFNDSFHPRDYLTDVAFSARVC